MNQPNDTPMNDAVEATAAKASEKKSIQKELEEELSKWRTKRDELKVKMHLASKDAQDAIQPHVDEVEKKLAKVDADWERLEEASGNAWQEISKGLSLSLKAMKQSLEKADEHFDKEKK